MSGRRSESYSFLSSADPELAASIKASRGITREWTKLHPQAGPDADEDDPFRASDMGDRTAGRTVEQSHSCFSCIKKTDSCGACEEERGAGRDDTIPHAFDYDRREGAPLLSETRMSERDRIHFTRMTSPNSRGEKLGAIMLRLPQRFKI